MLGAFLLQWSRWLTLVSVFARVSITAERQQASSRSSHSCSPSTTTLRHPCSSNALKATPSPPPLPLVVVVSSPLHSTSSPLPATSTRSLLSLIPRHSARVPSSSTRHTTTAKSTDGTTLHSTLLPLNNQHQTGVSKARN